MGQLAILVPVYQREHGALRAVRSVLSQAGRHLDQGSLTIHVRDDASPSIDAERFRSACHALDPRIAVDINPSNLGMSANIRLMVSQCTAAFCTILTDDDWFEPGSIDLVIDTIHGLDRSCPEQVVASVFCPRYSYTEAGQLAGISCRIATGDKVMLPSPLSAMEIADEGYILTGLFFRPGLVDQAFWGRHQENAFFPILYFASLLIRGSCLYLDQPLVHHTVFNHCHWQAWGNTVVQQQQRLCRDFLLAIRLVHCYLRPHCGSLAVRLSLWPAAVRAYRDRLVEMRMRVWDAPMRCIPWRLWLDPLFLVAFCAYVYFMARTGRGEVRSPQPS
ncbi:MAG: glycosyltransferase family 2 protein [Cyanobacteria bacterium J06638_7]